MAAFSDMAAAEQRARTLVAAGTWLNAFAARTFTGAICVRVQRKMSPSAPDAGGWVELTDDSQT